MIRKTGLLTAFALIHVILCYFGLSLFGEKESPISLWVTLFLAVALFLPFTSFLRVSLLCLFLVFLLNILNYFKMEYFHQALSQYDFSIIFSSFGYLFDDLFGYGIQRYIIPLLLIGFFPFLMVKFHKFPYSGDVRKITLKISAIIFGVVIFLTHYSIYQGSLEKYLDSKSNSQRQKNELVTNLDVLGTISYLGSKAAFFNVRSILKKEEGYPLVPAKEIKRSAKRYLGKDKKDVRPNIVFVLAKSTFDPNEVFLLNSPYRDNSLFSSGKNEQSGNLGVSLAGSGTWITEFEAVSGISTKALVTRDYINGALAPRLKTTFIRYLKEKGYDSSIFFPIIASYINNDKIFKEYYGFDIIEDEKTLGLDSEKMHDGFDQKMMDRVIAKFPKKSANPFISHIILMENNGPHRCKAKFLKKEEFRLKDDVGFKKNCEIAEYLKRAKSSEIAIKKLEAELRRIEKEDARPFIIVVFGDHQPWVFNQNRYDNNRIKGSSRYVTYYKIITSDSISLPKIPKLIPANLLPSLVSSVFATKTEELYIPENFYLFERCRVINNVEGCFIRLKFRRLDYGNYFTF